MGTETRDRGEFISPREAAERLGVSVGTVHNLFDDPDGPLDGYRLPRGHRKISKASVESLYAATRGKPPKRGPGGRPRKTD